MDERKPIKMERAVVARGRTVAVPTNQKRIATYTADGKAVTVTVLKHFGPDQEVELPSDEVAWLRSTGHLTDPSIPPPPQAKGPQVTEMGQTAHA